LSQRLAAIYILYEMYRSEKASSTPFSSLISEIIQTSQNVVEKKLIVEFNDISSKVIFFKFIEVFEEYNKDIY
jgi:hypothetical protein